MSDRLAPRTRFGSVPFEVQWPGSTDAGMPDWQFSSERNTRHVPGSNRNITQYLGKGPQTLTLRLELASKDDLLSLKELVQETDTLVLFASMTSAPATYVDLHGEGYVEIANVDLIELGQPVIYLDDDRYTVEVDATFQRSA